MKEQIVELLTSKVGLDASTANQAVDTVLGYLKDNPEQVTSLLGKVGLGGIGDTLGGLFGGGEDK